MITDIFNGMYKAFFATAFADMVEEQGFSFPAGSDIMDYIPTPDNPGAIDAGALEYTTKLYKAIEPSLTNEFLDRRNGMGRIRALLCYGRHAHGRRVRYFCL
jgi:hypothetical protein